MKISGYIASCFALMLLFTNITNAQKVDFINSVTISEKFPEIIQAQKLLQILTDKWKSELDSIQQKVDSLEFEINKNRLIWTETELQIEESELITLRKNREDYARTIFEPNGKYDEAVKIIYQPIEEKIKSLEWQTD